MAYSPSYQNTVHSQLSMLMNGTRNMNNREKVHNPMLLYSVIWRPQQLLNKKFIKVRVTFNLPNYLKNHKTYENSIHAVHFSLQLLVETFFAQINIW
jgi:hypothetical protein